MRSSALTFLVVVLTAAVPGLVSAQLPARSPRNANYALTATLDIASRRIDGRGRLTWRNTAGIPATELRFHMYWNAWRDPDSTWLRERRLAQRLPYTTPQAADTGAIDLTKLTLTDGETLVDLLPRARYIAPDDGNDRDRTVLAVPLDRPVMPGETLVLEMTWNSKIPRPVARTGVLGDYYFIAQWFPKIGVFENAGWNCHQFHAATEFFSDFGLYEVELTVPSGWVVGATGRELARVENGNGTTSHRYDQADIHDFAWTTSPHFIDVRRRLEEPGLAPVDVRLLLQPEHADQADRHFSAARAALALNGQWFGPYPFEQLTMVDPVTVINSRAQGGETGGMEYPTLVTAGTRWVSPWKSLDPESVVVHEVGHQFFQGVVASNEVEHAWLDEGLTTYIAARVIQEAFPNRFTTVERYFGGLVAWPFGDVPWQRDVTGNRLATYRAGPSWDAQAADSWRYWPETARNTTYSKTALWLTSLERLLGWERMQRALSAYFTRYAFRHPVPADFFATMSEVSGRDLTWFFDAVSRTSAAFDYEVARVSIEPSSDEQTRSTVVVRRLGDGIFPVDIRMVFDDGAVAVKHWDGVDRWRAFAEVRAGRVRSVEIDPDRVLTLDLNYTNNSWTAAPRAAEAATSWAVRWMLWAQSLLLTYAFFA